MTRSLCSASWEAHQAGDVLHIFERFMNGHYAGMMFQGSGNSAKIFKKDSMEGFARTKILNFKF